MKSEQTCPLYLCYRDDMQVRSFIQQEVTKLKESVYKSYDELPLFLNAETVAKLLGVSATTAYGLLHRKDFPSIRIGSRLVVPKEKFREWADRQSERDR